MTPSLTQRLADFAAQTTFDGLPPEVVHSVELRFLDTLGICLAARSFGLADGIQKMVEVWSGKPEARLIGANLAYPAPNAALVNGTLAHSLDFDDTHLPSVLHPSASIVPAVLAMAEATGRTGADALVAAALGIEVTVRTGMAGYLPSAGNMWFERGWHATSICGTLGAAAGGRLLGLDSEDIMNALGIASSFGSGVIEANRAGGTVKRVHCGWAAHAGITAALMARHGMSGPPTALEGRFGLFQAFLSGQYDPAPITDGLGERWELPGIFFKPYPANHYTHAGIDAALAIRRRLGGVVDVDQVERIELGCAASPLRTIGEPRDEKTRPRSGYHAQFSGPFTVAAALLGGGGLGVYFDDFTDAMARDPARLALAAKVATFVDAECDAVFPREFPALVRVQMRDGRVLEERVMHNRGGPAKPLSDAEVQHKFALNAGHALSPTAVAPVAEAVFALPVIDGVAPLLKSTVP